MRFDLGGCSQGFASRALRWSALILFLCLPVLMAGSSLASALSPIGNIAEAFQALGGDKASGISEYRLKSNGLSILLAERHASPIVTVMLVYKVGSRNEAVGYTGATHFLEHMLFKGTVKHDPLKGGGIDDLLKPIGGINNATTSYDRTYYYEVVPSTSLALCLELEADRMRNALLRDSDRKSEMTVVRNELERAENYAMSILDTQVFATAFREHPYHHPVIGWRSDVEGVPSARLKQFFNDFYYPDNATLIVVGDFKESDALKLIAANFGKVPRSPKPFPSVYTTEPPQEGERRFTVQRGDEMAKIMFAYHTPNAVHADTYPLEVLASVLGNDSKQSSRLYRALVDSGLASSVGAFNYSLRDPALFTVYASATEGTDLTVLENCIRAELEKLKREPVTEAELDRAKKSVWKRMRLDAADPVGLATTLAEATAVADWKWWLAFEKNVKKVTAADLQRVAAKYFGQTNRTVGCYRPKPKTGETKSLEPGIGESTAPDKGEGKSSIGQTLRSSILFPVEGDIHEVSFQLQGEQLALAASPTIAAPQNLAAGAAALQSLTVKTPQKSAAKSNIAAKVRKRVLDNGLCVYVLQIPGTKTTSVSIKTKAGEYCSPAEKTLTADLVGETLNKGSVGLTKEGLANELEQMGSQIDFAVDTFWIGSEALVVTEDLPRFLQLLAKVVCQPELKAEELAKIAKVKEAEIRDAMVETREVAMNGLLNGLYEKDCVYYQKPFSEMLSELKAINSADLKEFHEKFYSASNSVVAVVGDVEPESAFGYVEAAFGGWKKGQSLEFDLSKCRTSSKPRVRKISIPDKSSVDVVLGAPADISMKSEDFFAAQIANSALGHDTIASRLAILREKHGLTYGISSYFLDNAEKNSPWIVGYSVNPENVQKAGKIVRGILDTYYKDGIKEDELKDEASRLAGEYVVYRLRGPRQLADALTKYHLVGVGPEFIDTYASRVKSQSRAQVNAAIKKYLNPDGLSEVSAGSLGN